MRPQYAVVAVHGISGKSGKTQSQFSDELAMRVMTEPTWKEKFWHETVWEGVFDGLDAKIRTVVAKVLDSYSVWDMIQGLLEILPGIIGIRSADNKSLWTETREKVAALFSSLLDHAIDLPLYLGSTYGEQIRQIAREKIQTAAQQAGGVVVVGHSLGSVIAHDVVAQLLAESNPPPIQALVTMGSPLEWVLDLRKENPVVFPRFQSLKWVNFYNVDDPIPLKKGLKLAAFPDIENVGIDAHTKEPLAAHSAYWANETVAEKLRELAGVPKGGAARSVMREERKSVRRVSRPR